MDGPEILKSVDQIEKLNKVARRTFGLEGIQSENRSNAEHASRGGPISGTARHALARSDTFRVAGKTV